MGFRDILLHGSVLVVLWILTLVLIVLICIFYVMQGQQMKRSGRGDSIRNLGNAMGVMGIFVSVIGFVWVIMVIRLVVDARNIGVDPSTIYVSRNNLYLNWHNPVIEGDSVWPKDGSGLPPVTSAINGDDPTDRMCFGNFSTDDPHGYEGYQKLIQYYAGTQPLKQAYMEIPYNAPIDGPATTTTPTVHEDTAENQRALSLAYYRFVWCYQTTLQTIFNGAGRTSGPGTLTHEMLPFLTTETIGRLNMQHGGGCDPNPTRKNLPDLAHCVSGDWPNDRGESCSPADVNPCFQALGQSIAAQCLLYDDLAYKKRHIAAAGALTSFGVAGAPWGYRLQTPVPKLTTP